MMQHRWHPRLIRILVTVTTLWTLTFVPDIHAQSTEASDYNRLMAGHLLRRIGFGPNRTEMNQFLKLGPTAYIEQQLNPASIQENLTLPNPPIGFREARGWIMRWYYRMIYSRRQLQEKMTLIWHEHFATSNEKVDVGSYMHDQEEFFRANALGNFRNLLTGIIVDQAMLIWLDNNDNDGQATDEVGNPLPPNENFGREFLQLFALGTTRLNLDGTPVTDSVGNPIPAYTEQDIKEIARALTGWHVPYRKGKSAVFFPWMHDSGPKTILGVTIPGRSGWDGANEVTDVVDIVMRQPTMAPFISKILIQKLATETPTAGYVGRVATVFGNTHADIKATVRAILADPEFTSSAVVRTQVKEPIEQFVGALRALENKTNGGAMLPWAEEAGQPLYYPPSVFSFYPPGQKARLLNTAYVAVRDQVSDAIAFWYKDTSFNAVEFIARYRLQTPAQAVDTLTDVLLAAPLDPEVRKVVLDYFGRRVTPQKVRGAAWLIMTSPDFQRN